MFYLTFVHPCLSTHTHRLTHSTFLTHSLRHSLPSSLPPSLSHAFIQSESNFVLLCLLPLAAASLLQSISCRQAKHSMRERENKKESILYERAPLRERESECSQDSCRCVCFCICLLHIFAIAGVCRQRRRRRRRQRCVAVVLRFSAHLDVATTT